MLPAVRDQGSCGASSWAFAAADLVASAHYRATGDVLELSVEQLLDCDSSSAGCNGGRIMTALSYARSEGLVTEQQLPFEAGERGYAGKCQGARLPPPATRLQSHRAVSSNNEDAMLASLMDGPIAVLVSERHCGCKASVLILPDKTSDESKSHACMCTAFLLCLVGHVTQALLVCIPYS